ncbi:hypothetical protein FORC31_p343 (plasmid) [Escherichia coli]|nr:hypothetical protein FORC31_p343 [Escherichia coli]
MIFELCFLFQSTVYREYILRIKDSFFVNSQKQYKYKIY